MGGVYNSVGWGIQLSWSNNIIYIYKYNTLYARARERYVENYLCCFFERN